MDTYYFQNINKEIDKINYFKGEYKNLRFKEPDKTE